MRATDENPLARVPAAGRSHREGGNSAPAGLTAAPILPACDDRPSPLPPLSERDHVYLAIPNGPGCRPMPPHILPPGYFSSPLGFRRRVHPSLRTDVSNA